MIKEKINYTIKQIGENPNYPNYALTWYLGEKIPEWLSDRANIKFMDAEGNMTLDVIESNNNSIDIINSGGKGVLANMKKDGVLIFNPKTGVISLTKKQFELLYEKIY